MGGCHPLGGDGGGGHGGGQHGEVKFVKEVKRSDGSWCFACSDVFNSKYWKRFDRQSLLLQKEELDDLDVGYDYKLRQELFTP